MNKLWKLVILCTCCLGLTAADSALADYIGLVHDTKTDDDIVDLCNNANGENVPEPLDVCNIFAQFDNPEDRLLSVGHGDITASNGLYYQNLLNPVVIAPTCFFVGLFPDLICDSFVTIGYKCGPDPAGTDRTAPDGDFDANEFANNGHVVGGWFNGKPPNGQGDPANYPCLRVLFLQLSVPTGASITGTISVFASIDEEVIEFANQVVDCFGAKGCPEGAPCYDCDPCTVDDTCDADGNCVGTPVVCDDGDDCNGVETCDPADGSCQDGEPIKCPKGEECVDGECVGGDCPEGDLCDDGDACTEGSTCDAGGDCVGGTPIDCSDQGDECNTASCDANGADGNCDILTPEPDGTACGDPSDTDCDDPDTCDGAGACQDNLEPSGTACPEDGNECTDDICDGSGTCTHPNEPDGTGCNDGDLCTENDMCSSGACSGTPIPCEPGEVCVDGECVGEGCPEGDACDDGDSCTVGSTCDANGDCVGGTPVDCADAGDQCNDASCDPNGGEGNCDILTPVKAGTECDDDDACTGGESCQGGSCTGGGPPNCTGAGDQCNDASCDPNGADGNCDILTPLPDGTACDDDDACTDPDQCTAGSCGGTDVDCSTAGDQCNDASCDPNGADGNCDTLTPLPDGTACDDDDACTDPDQCTAGSCGGAIVDCDGLGDQCNEASCDPNGADANCDILTPLPDGTECDDDDACTDPDQCTAGSCGGTDVDCSGAGDQCNDASCDPNGADGNCDTITPIKDGAQCNDDDVCTTGDACQEGQCVGGPPLECDDGNVCNGMETCDSVDGCQPGIPLECDDQDACTEDDCDPDDGCFYTTIDCDDGNACTEDGCLPDSGCTYEDVNCDDNDACTFDDCDPELGCIYAPIDCPPGETCVDGECVGQCQQRTLIVKQGACPAPVNPAGNGVVPILLVGDADFAAETAVRESLQLRLCDKPDGAYMAPIASFTRAKDINHPNAQDTECGGCTCNEDQSSDGIDDLSMKFRARELFTVLGLTPDSGQVTLELSGVLEDGTPFCARDCVLIVP